MRHYTLLTCALAAALGALFPLDAAAQTDRAPRVRDLRIESRSPRAAELGTGIVVLSVRGSAAGTSGGSVTFARRLDAEDAAALPRIAPLGFSVLGKSGRGNNDARLRQYKAFQAPPGRYVMSLYAPAPTGGSLPGRQYCFGTIAFDLMAGDVLYVGDFVNVGQLDPVIDFDLEDARRALAPALQGNLSAAQFVENVEFECSWAAMARFDVTDSERARLVAGGAMTAPVVETVVMVEGAAPTAGDASVAVTTDVSATAPVENAPSEATATEPPAPVLAPQDSSLTADPPPG
jgi:hypothetical protein